MKRLVPLMAMAACCMIGVSSQFAQDAPATSGAAPASAPAGGGQATILTTFPGDQGPGPKDKPDNVGAVGPNHVVDFTCANAVVRDKRTGKVIQKMTQTEFWKNAKPGFDFAKLNDPRIVYDPLRDRWYVGIHALVDGFAYMAVSETADPAKGWRGVKLLDTKGDPGLKFGLDKNGLYISHYILTGDIHTMMGIFAIPIADVVAADGPSLANMTALTDLENDCFSATDLDPAKPADAPEFVLSHDWGNSFSKMYMYKITWAGNKASISKLQTIPLSKAYACPNGTSRQNQASQPAPGDKLRADEGRRTQCVYVHGGSLFTCNEAKRAIDSRCGIFWCEIRASDGAILQEGFVDDPNCDYLVPSLAVDAKGNIGMGCTRTSEKEFPSAAVMMRAPGDPKNTMRPPVLAAKGTAVYSISNPGKYGIGWGNYNSTVIDPSDSTVFWTYQEYATSGVPDVWNTCWVAFKLK